MGIVKEARLVFTPEAQEGDYVIVHASFAISHLDEEEAHQTMEALTELEQMADEQDRFFTFTLQ